MAWGDLKGVSFLISLSFPVSSLIVQHKDVISK
jgi:hypothetical protein